MKDRTAALNRGPQTRHPLLRHHLSHRLARIDRQIKALAAGAAASLAGLAPVTRESGQWRGRGFIRGGRARPRRLLHMAAVAAIRHNPNLGRRRRELRGRGKPPKAALVAVMRKTPVLANALIRRDRLWTAEPVAATRIGKPDMPQADSASGLSARSRPTPPRRCMEIRQQTHFDKMDAQCLWRSSIKRPPRRQDARSGFDARAIRGGARSCATRFFNTHSTAERGIPHEFHPWFGQQAAIDRAFARSGVSVALRRQPGRGPRPPVEALLWTFDRRSCPTVRGRRRPHVDLMALEALADLLSMAVRDDGGASDFPSAVAGRHADLRSRDGSQGAGHAPIPPEVRPVGSVRSLGRQPTPRDAAMGRSAGPDAATGDGSDGPDAVGASRRPGRGGGGRSQRGER